MTLLIVAIIVMAYVLIASQNLTHINKATVAIFAGTVGWVIYICFGADFVHSQYKAEYFDWLNGATSTSHVVKQYIFLPYVARAAEIAFFLLATMSIADVLITNGCLDYLRSKMRTRNARKLLWMITAVTFIISANLDNLTTTIVMLMVMRSIVANSTAQLLSSLPTREAHSLSSASLLVSICGTSRLSLHRYTHGTCSSPYS